MSELLPSAQARRITDGLLDYLTTTFALADPDAQLALNEFLSNREHGIFKGPFLRLRLPFRTAEDGWQSVLGWKIGIKPHGHQAETFRRLSSADLGPDKQEPLPTLVTTGTGSGKTEAFLYPILDHVLRARRDGVTGMKALILYPMNALANDQAQRLADLITTRPELAGITAGLYTGQKGPERTKVSADGLITDRLILRDEAPDILLTNYKMLDQLLLRHDDARIWKQSAASLQYLVLDEFHTYDGAQGTDVAMLLRRLGLTIKSHLPDGALTEEEEARPLGKITPVATSATLGDKDDPSTMVGFASTVFGTKFGADSVVTETRRGLAEWTAGAADTVADIKPSVVPRRPMRADLAQINAAVVALSRGNGPGDDAGQESTGSGSGSWGSAGGGDAAAITFAVLGGLYELAEEIDPEGKGIVKKDGRSPAEVIREAVGDGPEKLLALVKAHPLVEELVPATERATHLGELAAVFWPESSAAPATGEEDDRIVFLTHLVAALSHVRLVAGHEALSVDLHLWVRELSRIDRVADSSASYRWSDDGETAGLADFGAEGVQQQAFPAIYCRLCGRSGWGVGLASVGSTLDADDTLIRRRKASGEGRFRALIYAPNEAEHELAAREAADDPDTPPGDRESKTVEGLRWFSVRQRVLLAKAPDDDDKDFRDGLVLPVLTQIGDDADDDSRDDVCPSCRRKDGIRFLGSAVATLLSVTLSTVFGDGELDSAEKKALVFTDSVQDSAHRAGFVGSRSHTLTLRAVLRQAVGDDMVSLDELVSRAIAAARDDPFGRYRMLPPDLVETKEFRAFWESERARDVPQPVRRRVRKRLLFDALLEFGLQSGFARTLEQTGSALAEVAAGEPQALAQMAREVLGTTEEPGALFGVADHVAERWLIAWVRGVLEHMRSDGAIEHDWFGKFIKSDGNRYFIWGGRPRGQGMPAFPKGRSAPEFPRVGPPAKGKDPLLVQVTSPQSWYARWTGQVLGVPPGHGARLARQLLERLARADILRTMATDSGGTVFAIPVTSVVVGPSDLADMRAGDTLLACDVCRTPHPAAPVSAAQLDGAPCLLVRCPGTLRRTSREDNYYRRLYASADMRRIVAREHTSLIPDKTRLEYEREFRQSVSSPNAPNVLVATPTLEMGIDIGDLSAVLLASLPKTVASYLQRVGRAGRLTGSALNLAFVTGRGEQLPRLEDPLSVINGKVRAPATYLSAEEILRRQYTAHLADCFAREESRPHPRRARIAIGSAGPGTFLGELIRFAEEDSDAHLDRFLSGFTGLADAAVDSLRAWAAPVGGEPSSSGLAMHLCDASRRWAATIEELKYRRTAITKAMRDLEKRAANPAATDDDKRAVVTATATLRMIGFESRRLNGQHWIAVLEEYGILPNYTLLDDSAVLDVSVSWIDPDTQKFETRPESFARSGVGALREFAPGATFYANKLEILIDAVDLGPDDSLVRTMAFCPNCGYAADLSGADPHSGNRGTSAPLACPRCGAVGVSGMENRLDVVDMRQVSAQVRRDEAVITDRSDQRVTEPFQIAIAPDIDPAFIARQWYLDGYDFGVKYLRRMVIRWVNLGRARRGPSREIAGEQATAPLFRVCSACGVLDRDAGANRPEEHRAWCRYRTDPDEHTRTIALGRTLTTQGAAIRLPRSVTVGDPFALPSLAAALLLGLHEQIGGSPDHIGIEQIHEPAPGERGVTGEALLLHDLVPGGTGYLAELAAPERMHDLLRRAWEKVRDCPCQHEPRLACHRCLIPFAPTRAGGLTFVSRVVAERHLRTILTGGDPSATPAGTMDWTLTSEEPPISSTESHLEQSFRKLFAERVEALGATVKETPGPLGNRMTIIFPSGERQWILEPQVTMGSSRPDFVLGSSQATIPPVAIFIDGWRYHASALHNRLADDARKRQDLRDGGAIVLGITHRDIDQAHENARTAPPWLNDSILGELMGATGAFRQRDTDAIRYGPVSFLLDWLQDPDPGGRRALADYLPYLFAQGSRQLQLSPAADLTREAALLLADPHHEPASEDSTAANPASMSWWWSNGTAGLLARATGEDFASLTIETVLVVDDRAETLADHDRSEDGWREWLRISNALVLRDQPTVITTLTDASVGAGEAGEKLRGVRKIEFDLVLDSDWQAARGLAESAAERAFLDGLAQATVTPQGSSLPAPEVGYETGDGLPVDFAWPDARIAVFLDLEDDDSRVLELPGWRVFGNDRDAVAAALREAA